MDDGRRRYRIGQSSDVTAATSSTCATRSSVDDAHGHGPLEAGRRPAGRRRSAGPLRAPRSPPAAASRSSVLEHRRSIEPRPGADTQGAMGASRGCRRSATRPCLSGGIKWQPTQVNPKDMALTGARAVQREPDRRPARRAAVPRRAPVGGDSMTYGTSRAARLPLARPGCGRAPPRSWPACREWLLPRGTTVEVNQDEYVQPEPLRARADRRDPEPDPRRARQPGDDRRRDQGGGTLGRHNLRTTLVSGRSA